MTQSRFADEETLAHLAELEEQVKQQAAVIEQMREALREYAEWTQVSRTGESPTITYSNDAYKALALQPCPEVLNKVKRDAVIENAEAWKEYTQRIEKGEA